jgi:hypothetical protein
VELLWSRSLLYNILEGKTMFTIGDKVKLLHFSKKDKRFSQFVNQIGEIIDTQDCGKNEQFVRVSYGKGKNLIAEHRGAYIDVGCWRLKKVKVST